MTFEAQGSNEMNEWPSLSKIKYVSGRVATEQDINEGAAVFLLQSEGVNIGQPINITLPQYAIHTDGDTGGKSKVVVIQAEEANGQRVVGALIISNNEYLAALYNEFEFLGNEKPGE